MSRRKRGAAIAEKMPIPVSGFDNLEWTEAIEDVFKNASDQASNKVGGTDEEEDPRQMPGRTGDEQKCGSAQQQIREEKAVDRISDGDFEPASAFLQNRRLPAAGTLRERSHRLIEQKDPQESEDDGDEGKDQELATIHFRDARFLSDGAAGKLIPRVSDAARRLRERGAW